MELCGWRARSLEAVFRTRVTAVADLGGVTADGIAHRLAQGSVALEELRLEGLVEPQHVVQHQHLPVTPRARADADGGDRERGGDPTREWGRDQLEHDGEGSGILERIRVGQELLRRRLFPALDPVAAERVYR